MTDFHPVKLKFVLQLLLLLSASKGIAQKAEAEVGTLQGTGIEATRPGFSGSGYVTGFDQTGDAVAISFDVDQAGLYDLYVGYAAPYGEKTNDIHVNGSFAGSQIFPSGSYFTEGLFGKVNLKSGTNEIRVVHNWGWFELDYIRVEPTQPYKYNDIAASLIHPQATFEANILYQYLKDLYGHRIISGQQAGEGESTELNYIQQHTGKLPAIKGFDLIDYSPSRVARGTISQQTERSIDWWEDRKGIISLMWHWNAPKNLIDTTDAEWWRGFYTYATTFDHRIAMNDEDSEEYELIIRDIDAVAAELKQIKAVNAPVLWRPLHEAEGGWFWWGARGPEACVWLWKLMYDRLTDHHGLNNLIWVWTGTNSDVALDWYPGDAYVDIVGADIYLEDKNYSAGFSLFDDMAGIHEGKKILAMSESGTIPDPDALDSEGARWSWFCIWSGSFILNGSTNEVAHIDKVYNHEYVITYDELPDFYNYESPEFPKEEPLGSVRSPDIEIYPNPATDGVTLSSAVQLQGLVVYNLKGELISIIDKKNFTSLQMDLRQYPSGIYLFRVISPDGAELFKVVKK